MKRPTLATLAASLALLVADAATRAAAPDPSFFKDCAFVSVDVQEPGPRHHMTQAEMPKEWVGFGFTVEDVNAAVDYAYDVAYPNSKRVAEACRGLGLPILLVHWGCQFRDGMDLDPAIRDSFLKMNGTNYDAWGHHDWDPGSRPAALLGSKPTDYVIAKSGQDAFNSSNIGFVLTNLHVKHIVFIGGHTGACLGKTAASAKRLGYTILAVEDATFDARESGRIACLDKTGYDYRITTDEFLKLVASARR
jgi:nicotinamidase-related amidase